MSGNKPKRSFTAGFAGAVLLAALLSGCTTVDYQAMREADRDSFIARMEENSAELLPGDLPLTLPKAIEIALENNLDIRLKDLQTRLARLDRQAAFGNFLPAVDLNYAWSSSDPLQKMKAGGVYMQTSDRAFSYAKLEVQQPIFLPQTWLMYSMRQKGQDIGELLAERTRQLISLQVIGEYYACLSLEQSSGYLQQAIRESETLRAEVQAWEREGLATPAQLKRAEALLLSRQIAWEENTRQLRLAKADLLETLGLNPLADFQLQPPDAIQDATPELPDLMTEALLNRLEIHVADRNIELQKDQTRMAIAEFLPSLFGLGDVTYNSNSFLKYSSIWSGGVAGVLTVFDGFRNINQYRSARETEQEGFLKREQLCLSILLEVFNARLEADRAAERLKLAECNLESVKLEWREIQAHWREGLIRVSDYLEAETRRDEAQTQIALARYRHQLALAALGDVTGKTRKESSQS